ncbi:MAG TPA: SDR family oxidoreductase [Lacunisphaera sp.]|nr:SDR family oxidoreductase [Lacunisphaera sp.]
MSALKNKVALITGGSRGIGRAIALALAREGCHVALTGRNAAALEEVAAAARAMGVNAAPIARDLAEPSSAAQIMDQTVSALGPVDFLVNNAAVLHATALLDTTAGQWDETMAINLRSVFLLSQLVLRHMAGRRSGYIVNIASTVAHGAKQDVAAYSVSKYGLVGLSHALHGAAKPFGVRVSTIYPGVTDTPLVRELNGDHSVGEPNQWMQPEDVAYCVLFLLQQSPRMIVKELTPWAFAYDKI